MLCPRCGNKNLNTNTVCQFCQYEFEESDHDTEVFYPSIKEKKRLFVKKEKAKIVKPPSDKKYIKLYFLYLFGLLGLASIVVSFILTEYRLYLILIGIIIVIIDALLLTSKRK